MTKKEFISTWINKISDDGIKLFPSEFTFNENLVSLKLPGKTLVIGEKLFGFFEILTTDGTPVLNVSDHSKAKYIIYSNRTKPVEILIPQDDASIKESVSKYENYLDEIIRQIENDYKRNFPVDKNSSNTVNGIFKLLNLVRY